MIIEHYIDFISKSMKTMAESLEKMQKGSIEAFDRFIKLLSENSQKFLDKNK